MNKRPLKSS